MSTYYFYVYKLIQDGKGYIGFGKTKHPYNRHKVHVKAFEKSGVQCEQYVYQACKSKEAAIDLETRVKREFCKSAGLKINDFRTESLPVERFAEFRDFISKFDHFDFMPTQTPQYTFEPARNFIKGSKVDKQAFFYLYDISHDGIKYIGYGITSDIIGRDYSHQLNFNLFGAIGKLVHVKAFQNTSFAKLLERKLRTRFPKRSGLKVPGFLTESILYDKHESVFEIIGAFNEDLAKLLS